MNNLHLWLIIDYGIIDYDFGKTFALRLHDAISLSETIFRMVEKIAQRFRKMPAKCTTNFQWNSAFPNIFHPAKPTLEWGFLAARTFHQQ